MKGYCLNCSMAWVVLLRGNRGQKSTNDVRQEEVGVVIMAKQQYELPCLPSLV